MSDEPFALEHERQRLYSLVDQFIEKQSDPELMELAGITGGFRIEDAVIVCACAGEDEDGDIVEDVVTGGESKKGVIRLGILIAAADKERARMAGLVQYG